MNVSWRRYRLPMKGSARGYVTFMWHLHKALHREPRVTVTDWNGGPIRDEVMLHVCPPHVLRPLKGCTNVLFSMWEGDVLPDEVLEHFRRADQWIVPSTYNRVVWGMHEMPASVAPLGISSAFARVSPDRNRFVGTDRLLRFLWLGAQNPRKGVQLLAPAWQKAFGGTKAPVQLYFKTIAEKGSGGIESQYGGRVIIDSRDLEPVDILKLYATADVFVFPSVAEGFGLPALEAMASGCLAISTNSGGLSEFVSDRTALVIPRPQQVTAEYGARFEMWVPTADGIAALLRQALDGWGTPQIETIRQQGCLHARGYTWARTARAVAGALISPASGLAVAV